MVCYRSAAILLDVKCKIESLNDRLPDIQFQVVPVEDGVGSSIVDVAPTLLRYLEKKGGRIEGEVVGSFEGGAPNPLMSLI